MRTSFLELAAVMLPPRDMLDKFLENTRRSIRVAGKTAMVKRAWTKITLQWEVVTKSVGGRVGVTFAVRTTGARFCGYKRIYFGELRQACATEIFESIQ